MILGSLGSLRLPSRTELYTNIRDTTQGLPAYNEKAVFRTLEKVYQVGRKLDRFIDDLEKRYFVGGDQNDRH